MIDEIGAYSDKEWHIAYREYNAHRQEPLPMTHIPAHKVDALVKQYNERYKRQLPAKRAYDKIRQEKIKESKKLENTSASVPNTSVFVPNDLDSIPFEFDEDFLSQDVDQHDGGKRSRTKHRRTKRSGTRRSGTRRKTYKRK